MMNNGYTALKPFGITLCVILMFISRVYPQKYTAVVLAYKSLREATWPAEERLSKNVDAYVQLINSVKDKADIIVFPDYGTTTIDVKYKVKEHLLDYSMIIGDLGSNPCKDSNTEEQFRDENLRKLSCTSISAGVYTVLGAVEKDKNEDIFYLTNVVFDRKGKIVLKCRRTHDLGNGTDFNVRPLKCDHNFTADFKSGPVQFLLLFDLVHKVRDDVKNYIITSVYRNQIPLQFGLAHQSGFAARNKINLLASGYFDYQKRYGGSGIYCYNGTGSLGKVAMANLEGNAKSISSDVVTVKEKNRNTSVDVQFVERSPSLKYTDVDGLDDVNKTTKYCFEPQKICCHFEAQTENANITPYRWIATFNRTKFQGEEVLLFQCAVSKPETTDQDAPLRFKSLKISATFGRNYVNQILPFSFNKEYFIPSYEYEETETESSVRLSNYQGVELVGFGLTLFLDPDEVSGGANVRMQGSTLVAMVVFAFLLRYLVEA